MLWYSRISWNISFLPSFAASVRGVSPRLFLTNASARILCFLWVAWRNMSCDTRKKKLILFHRRCFQKSAGNINRWNHIKTGLKTIQKVNCFKRLPYCLSWWKMTCSIRVGRYRYDIIDIIDTGVPLINIDTFVQFLSAFMLRPRKYSSKTQNFGNGLQGKIFWRTE